MKKKWNKITDFVALFFLLVFIFTLFQSSYHQFFFILKHASLFLFIGFFLYSLILRIYEWALKKELFETDERQVFLKLFTVVVFTLLLLSSAAVQRYYINTYETPTYMRSTFYDTYGNYIHSSRFNFILPTEEVSINTEEEYQVSYTYKLELTEDETTNYQKINDNPQAKLKELYAVVVIDLHYDLNHNITSYIYTETIQSTLYEYPDYISYQEHGQAIEVTYKTSSKLSIETSYSDSLITQVKERYTHDYGQVDQIHYDEINPYDFTEEEPMFKGTYVMNFSDTPNEFYLYLDDDIDYYIHGEILEPNLEEKTLTLTYNPDYFADELLNKTRSYEFDITDETVNETYNIFGSVTESEYQYYDEVGLLLKIEDNNQSNSFYDSMGIYQLESQDELYRFIQADSSLRVDYYQKQKTNTNFDLFELTMLYGWDYYAIGTTSGPTNLVYPYLIVLDFNSMIKYILN